MWLSSLASCLLGPGN